MSLLLHIDTAVTTASVCLTSNTTIVNTLVQTQGKEAASWLHIAIDEILKSNGFAPKDLQAIAISEGPGSYTGLRVGMATAKGLCYALDIPLITISTLQMMAAAAKEENAAILCPMIDARRMEVFTALYNQQLTEILPPGNLILTPEAFAEHLAHKTISFFGNGSNKAKDVIQHSNASFICVEATAADMVEIALQKYDAHQFADLAYAEPSYGKAFHSSVSTKIY